MAVAAAAYLLGSFVQMDTHMPCMHGRFFFAEVMFFAEVYSVSFWLMKYGCPSPKRLLLRSNWPEISKMDLGTLPREEMQRLTTVKTARLLAQFGFNIYVLWMHKKHFC